ncbi:hypothetical protein Dimus_017807 [Dionaea muscipula]
MAAETDEAGMTMMGWWPSEEEEGLGLWKQTHESATDFDWVGVNHGSGVCKATGAVVEELHLLHL